MTPVAPSDGEYSVHWRIVFLPFREITIETMKKPTATIAKDSRHVKPMARILLANCHVAALGTVSNCNHFVDSKILLEGIRNPVRNEAHWAPSALIHQFTFLSIIMNSLAYFRPYRGTGSKSLFVHRALPSAKADFGWSTLRCGRLNFMTPILYKD